MTSFAAILGFLPLASASGAGALARQVTGFVLIGGMLAASFIAICFVPLTFFVVERLGQGRKEKAVDSKGEGSGHD